MRNLFLTIVCFLAMTTLAFAGSVTLGWDALPDQANGVRIYIGTETGVYTNSHDAGAGVSETVVNNLVPGIKYFFAAKAYTPNGIYSDGYSNEVFTTIPSENILPELPPISVGNVTITIKVE